MKILVHRFILLAAGLSLLSACTSDEPQEQNHLAEDVHTEVSEMSNTHQIHADTSRAGAGSLSPPRMAMADIAQTQVLIEYNAPSVRDRIIWGGLVGYDRIWVTGAHMATAIQFEHAVRIKNNVVPAGKYALFTIPGRETWTVIINENWDQHLADDYDQSLDLIRFEVVPELHEFTEQLTYTVLSTNEGSGTIKFMWEKLKLSISVEVAKES